MTEKRFTLKNQDDYFGITDNNSHDKVNVINGIRTEIEAEWLCDLLNELHEENEELKRKNKFLKNQYERKDRQLHRTKKDIEKYTDYFMNELNWDCDRIIKEVFK